MVNVRDVLATALCKLSIPYHFCNIAALEIMLASGLSADMRNNRGDTPLHHSFSVDENNPLVHLLMEGLLPIAKENFTNCDGLNLLHIACAKSTLADVQDLLNRFLSDIDCQVSSNLESPYAGYTPLHFAVHHGRYEIATLLLKHDANFYTQDRNGSSPLHLALNRKDIKMIDLILLNDHLHNNCVDNSGLTHFMAACVGTKSSVVNEFLCTATTVRRISPLVLIMDRVKNTLHQFAGYSPLHFAALSGNTQTALLLLQHQASCFALTNDNFTPFDIARNLGFEEMCQLLQKFADNRKDEILANWMSKMMVE